MKNLDYYMSLNYKAEVFKNEEGSGYVLRCPELKGCITYAATLEQGFEMLEDAKRCWITACIEDNIPIPEPVRFNDWAQAV